MTFYIKSVSYGLILAIRHGEYVSGFYIQNSIASMLNYKHFSQMAAEQAWQETHPISTTEL